MSARRKPAALPTVASSLPIVLQPELRALPLLATVPAGHIAFPVPTNKFLPHLKPGEFAIADTADREPQAGEFYVIEWSNGRRDLVEAIRRHKAGEDVLWSVGDHVRPRSWEECQAWMRAGRSFGTIEGPMKGEHLKTKMVGRVVAVLDSPGDYSKPAPRQLPSGR